MRELWQRAWHFIRRRQVGRMDAGDDVDDGTFSVSVLDLGNAFRMQERPVS
jgi:hypothetical protein